MSELEEQVTAAVGEVAWNASNYPRKAQAHIWGADIGPLRDKITAAVLPLVRRAQAEAFEAGWRSSGEGCNGEYPDEGVPWDESTGREAYTRWIADEGQVGA